MDTFFWISTSEKIIDGPADFKSKKTLRVCHFAVKRKRKGGGIRFVRRLLLRRTRQRKVVDRNGHFRRRAARYETPLLFGDDAIGYYGRIAPRSSVAWKHHIDVGAGVIDEDYRGLLGIVLFNHGSTDFTGKSCLRRRINLQFIKEIEWRN